MNKMFNNMYKLYTYTYGLKKCQEKFNEISVLDCDGRLAEHLTPIKCATRMCSYFAELTLLYFGLLREYDNMYVLCKLRQYLCFNICGRMV